MSLEVGGNIRLKIYQKELKKHQRVDVCSETACIKGTPFETCLFGKCYSVFAGNENGNGHAA